MTSTSRKPEPLPNHDTYQTISNQFPTNRALLPWWGSDSLHGPGSKFKTWRRGSRIHQMSLGACNFTRSRMSGMQTHHWKPFTLTAWHIQMGKIAALPKFGCHSAN